MGYNSYTGDFIQIGCSIQYTVNMADIWKSYVTLTPLVQWFLLADISGKSSRKLVIFIVFNYKLDKRIETKHFI